MLNRILLILFLACCGECFTARASTNVVISGSDFQQAIASSSPGDTLVVQSGIYNGNINFDRSLTVLCSGTQIQLSGNTSVSSNANVNLSQTLFVGTFQAAINTVITVSQCIFSNSITLGGGTFQAFDTTLGSFTATGGKATLKRCVCLGNINLTGTGFEALRLTCPNSIASIVATATPGSGTRFMIVQSAIIQDWWNITGYQVYLGYNNIYGSGSREPVIQSDTTDIILLQNCDSILVGNLFYQVSINNRDGGPVYALMGHVRAYNNRFHTDTGGQTGNPEALILASSSGEIINNTFECESPVRVGAGFDAAFSNNGPIIVRGNAIYVPSGDGVYADTPFISECSYNCVDVGNGTAFVNVSPINCLTADPMLSLNSYLTNGVVPNQPSLTWLAPNAGSPCFNAGPPDAIYNNTDGTRNTMGYTGGPLWNPANYTNNNPIMFFLNTTNQMVLKGVQSTVQINLGASAGH
jgi:hypothetical protein